MLQPDKIAVFRDMLTAIAGHPALPAVRRALAILLFFMEEQDKRITQLTERCAELEQVTAELDLNVGCLFDEMISNEEPEESSEE